MAAPFSVIFSPTAAEELRKLPLEIQERVKKKLHDAQEYPFHYFERLTGRCDYKCRVGDYRVIADLNKTEQRIEVTTVGHRKNIYDQRN
ncbi:MAG: type II toxin-antitoxin system RelE/ParE family toxin [Nanoarchaeota archaeon]